MKNFLIRDLPDADYQALRDRARAEGRPMVTVARDLLARALRRTAHTPEARVALSERLRAQAPPQSSDSTELLRQARDTRRS